MVAKIMSTIINDQDKITLQEKNMHGESAYGLWTLVLINSAIFIFFAFSFTKPQTKTDWRSLGLFPHLLLPYLLKCMGSH